MSKKYDKGSKHSQYDDYEEGERFHKKKTKNKKKNCELDFISGINTQKQKVNNRYLNKKRDKDKYDRDDDWN